MQIDLLPENIQYRIRNMLRKRLLNGCLELLKQILVIFDDGNTDLCETRQQFNNNFLRDFRFGPQLLRLVQQMVNQDCFVNLLNLISDHPNVNKIKSAYEKFKVEKINEQFMKDFLWGIYQGYRQPSGKNPRQIAMDDAWNDI